MSNRILLLVLCLLITAPQITFARGLGRIPTQEQLDKYCIKVQLKIDGDYHYFAFSSIAEMTTDNGLLVKIGKDKIAIYKKEDIDNWDECYQKYIELLIKLGGSR